MGGGMYACVRAVRSFGIRGEHVVFSRWKGLLLCV